MATLARRGSGTPVDNGVTTWASKTNAVDGTPGTNPATYATWTNSTSGAVGYIEVSGYSFSDTITASDTINTVTVKYRGLVGNTGRISAANFQCYDGSTAIGSAFSFTHTTSAADYSTTFAVTNAQLRSANFKVRATFTHSGNSQSLVVSIDHIDVTVDYTPPPPTITQAGYRWYNDASESGSTALATENNPLNGIDITTGNVNLHLRVMLQNTSANPVQSSDDFALQYDKNSSGSWTTVTTGTTNVAAFASANVTDAAATTQRLTAGSGSFQAGEISETGTVTDLGWGANNYTELLYTVQLKTADLANNDTLTFRVLYNGATTQMTYSVTPTTQVFEAAVAVTQAAFRFYADDGSEAASTALAAQDTNYDLTLNGSFNFHLRMRLQSTTAAPIPSTDDWQLQYRSGAGSWSNIPTSTSFTLHAYNSANLTNATATTSRLTGGTGSFSAGSVSEDGLVDNIGFSGANHTELLYSLRVNADQLPAGVFNYSFRVLRNGAVTDMTYAVTPVINITKVHDIEQDAYRWYADGTEAGSTALAAENASYIADLSSGDVLFGLRIRWQIGNANPIPSLEDKSLSYRINGGSWTGIYDNAPSPQEAVYTYDSANLTDGEVTTQRLSSGTGSFSPGKVAEQGYAWTFLVPGNSYTELLFPVGLNASLLDDGDTIEFRTEHDYSTTDFTYVVTPTINVSIPTGPIPTSGLVGWWDADDASTFTYSSGSIVSQWNDKSGAGHHFAQATASLQPNRNGTQNGHTTVVFDGTDDYMDTGSFTEPQPITVFIAHNALALDTQGWFSSVGGNLQIWVGSNSLRFYAGSQVDSSNSGYSGSHVWRAVFDGASSSIHKDGVSFVTGDVGTAGTTTGFRLAERNLTAGYVPKGALFEMIVYDRVLTGPEVTQVESYLTDKWITGAPVGGKIKWWNGSAWVDKPIKVWTGSAWVEKPLKVWTGSAWALS